MPALRLLVPAVICCIAVALPCWAGTISRFEGLLAPAEDGKLLDVHGPEGSRSLDRAELERFPLWQSTLKTAWGQSGTFQGVLLNDLLAAYQITGFTRLRISASDGYVIFVTPGEIAAATGLIATRLDGAPISVSDKGPLLLLWPEQESAAFAGGNALATWVWGLVEIGRKIR
jgi:hypothetical protein